MWSLRHLLLTLISTAASIQADEAANNTNSTTSSPRTLIKILWFPTSVRNGTPSYVPIFELNAGALSIALNEARASGLIDPRTTDVELVYRDSENANITLIIEYMLQMHATPGSFQMLLGPAISTAARVVSIAAQAIDRLHIIWGANAPEMSNRVIYPRVIRPQPSYYPVTQCMLNFFISRNMIANLAVISYEDSIQCPLIVSAMKQTVRKYNITVATYAILTSDTPLDQITAKLQRISLTSRIIFGCGMLEPANLARTIQLYQIIAAAKKLGMINSAYQWILMMTADPQPFNHPLFLSQRSMPTPGDILRANNIELTVPELVEAMKYFLYTYMYMQNRGDAAWRQRVRDELANAPWYENMTRVRNELRAVGIRDDDSPAFMSPHLADSFTLYLIGVQRARAAGLDYENPYVMYDILRNVTFRGHSGYFALNRDGERLPDMALHGPAQDYDSKSMAEKFELKGSMRCTTDRNIQTDSEGITGILELNRSFAWYTLDGLPPPAIPLCGYQNELCRFASLYLIASIVGGMSILVIISGVLVGCVLRQRREAKLLRMDWLLKPSEIREKMPAYQTTIMSQLQLQRQQSNNSETLRQNNNQSALSLNGNNSDQNNVIWLNDNHHEFPKAITESFDDEQTSSCTEMSVVDFLTVQQNSSSYLKTFFHRATYRDNIQTALYKWPWTPANDTGTRLNARNFPSFGEEVSTAHPPAQQLSFPTHATTTFTAHVLAHRECLHELQAMRRVNHDNLCAFIGAYYGVEMGLLVFAYSIAQKRTLSRVLRRHRQRINQQPLAWFFKQSILLDIALGLDYLQNSTQLEFHGRLSSDYVVVDSRWVTKLTGFGRWSFGIEHPQDFLQFESDDEDEVEAYKRRLLWTAPEVLRKPTLLDDFVHENVNIAFCHRIRTGSVARKREAVAALKRADVYSFGVVMSEVVYDIEPYTEHQSENGVAMRPSEIIEQIIDGAHLRPLSDENAAIESVAAQEDVAAINSCRRIMIHCWAEDPTERPPIKKVCQSLRSEARARGTGSLVDTVIAKLELYAKDLESLVQARTHDLQEEKRRADGLLRRLLPESVAEQLKRGEPIVPQMYESASVYFSDIVSFTTIASLLTPLAVVDLLNKVFMYMDDVLSRYAVYKMETIGDGYMVVSGLPKRISTHAIELASMALDIRDGMTQITFESLQQQPSQSIRIRLGLHSGPVVAGVVGLTMPRYCLFGDTVNVASRMESQGEPMQIQISESTRQLLGAEYIVRERGAVKIKGKGEMHTYWLDDGPTRRY